jgi:hypothetical protein
MLTLLIFFGPKTNPNEKERIEMQKIMQTFREIVLPFVIAQSLIAVFFAGWAYLWIG